MSATYQDFLFNPSEENSFIDELIDDLGDIPEFFNIDPMINHSSTDEIESSDESSPIIETTTTKNITVGHCEFSDFNEAEPSIDKPSLEDDLVIANDFATKNTQTIPAPSTTRVVENTRKRDVLIYYGEFYNNWEYNGEFTDHESSDRNCEFCDRFIRYTHVIWCSKPMNLDVCDECGNEMIADGVLKNNTNDPLCGFDPYSVLSTNQWGRSRKGNIQFKVRKRSRLFDKIVNFFEIKYRSPSFNIYLYPNGNVFIPECKDHVEKKKGTPGYDIMRKNIRDAYLKSQGPKPL